MSSERYGLEQVEPFEIVVGAGGYSDDPPTVLLQELETLAQGDLKVCAEESDWSRSSIGHLIHGLQEHTKIGAEPTTIDTAYRLIKAMVVSENVFHGTNLQTFAFFLLHTGSVLDAMAESSPYNRLTIMLRALKRSPYRRTIQQMKDIDRLSLNLGRSRRR
jgi:hypothetical protein